MQIDIPAHIEKLLFLHDTLTIPGFGTFTATKISATADYVGGTVAPPSKSLTFSDNMTTDDGILVNDISVTHNISSEEARRAVTDFVEKMQAQLNQREIVTLPAVGRLYKNYVQKIQFLPDTTNFSPESFGLPPLQFSPIARSREVEKGQESQQPTAAAESTVKSTFKPAAQPANGQNPPPPAPEPYTPSAARSGGAGWATAIGIALLFVALSGGYWLWQKQKEKLAAAGTEKTEQTSAPLPGLGKTNESPKKAEKPTPKEEKPAVADNSADDSENAIKESVAEKTAAAREEVKTTKGGRECILVIATLSEKANADRLEQMLKEEGFNVYLAQQKGFQVGVRFFYNDRSEIQSKITTLQNLTGVKNIYVKKK
jgi:nucleoid DNA-binding protein